MVAVPEGLRPVRRFDAACELVLDYLTAAAPMGMWAVTRVASEQQTMLMTRGAGYPITAGDQFLFAESMCGPMVTAAAPQIAPDVSTTPAYADLSALWAGRGITVGAYVGAPIVHGDNELFGTVCGFSPRQEPASLHTLQPLLAVFTSLLSTVLEADLAAVAATRAVDTARHEADIDALTGLLNRRGWNRFVALEEQRHRRFGDPASVVMVDLDRLKDVNDRHGHDAGDRHIQAAADVLRGLVRSSDVLARLGGDEFAVLAVGADAHQAENLVSRMEEALDRRGVSGSAGHAPYSIIAGFPGALKAADAAMYERKQRRRTGPSSTV